MGRFRFQWAGTSGWSSVLTKLRASERLRDNPRLTTHCLCNIHSALGQRLWSRHTLFLDGRASGYVEQQWRAIVAITALLGKLTRKLHSSFKYHQTSKGCSARRMINLLVPLLPSETPTLASKVWLWEQDVWVSDLSVRNESIDAWMDGKCLHFVCRQLRMFACVHICIYASGDEWVCMLDMCVCVCEYVSTCL